MIEMAERNRGGKTPESKKPNQQVQETPRQRRDRIDRIDKATEKWRKEHPGEPVPWQIGG